MISSDRFYGEDLRIQGGEAPWVRWTHASVCVALSKSCQKAQTTAVSVAARSHKAPLL